MLLKLHRTIGYESNGHTPIAGSAIYTCVGNKNQCTKQAKAWLRDFPQPIAPIWKWY